MQYPDHNMLCPHCATPDTRVVDSRPADGGSAIRRRRHCTVCGRRFTTFERPAIVLQVRKRSGALEPFDAAKLRHGVERALADRPVPAGVVESLLSGIEQRVADLGPEVPADEIGALVLDGLRVVDEVAYLRFASVYKEFTGASDFEREVAAMESDA